MVNFWIQAQLFDTEFGPVWRGRAVNDKRELNFKLPLPPDCSQTRAELSVIYELARTLPSILGPNEEVHLHVPSDEVRKEAMANEAINQLIGDLTLTIEVVEHD